MSFTEWQDVSDAMLDKALEFVRKIMKEGAKNIRIEYFDYPCFGKYMVYYYEKNHYKGQQDRMFEFKKNVKIPDENEPVECRGFGQTTDNSILGFSCGCVDEEGRLFVKSRRSDKDAIRAFEKWIPLCEKKES